MITTSIMDRIVQIVEFNKVIRHQDIYLKLMSEFPHLSDNDILEALSTASQDSLIKRFEIQIPPLYHYTWFYVPTLAKLI